VKTQAMTRAGANVVAYAATIIFLIPIYILINLSLRPTGDTTPGFLPSRHATLDNYITAWTTSALPGSILTSVVVTTLSSVLVLAMATMAAYPLARSTARLSTATFYTFLVGLLLPFQLAVLPIYFQMRDLGLLGTIWSLIIVYGGVQMPFSIFLITTFLRTSVPAEYEEAAQIDGCGSIRTFWHVVVPLLRPVLGTCLILNGVGIWNDFFTPLLYLSGSDQQTVPVAVAGFVGQFVSDWNLTFAALIISIAFLVAWG